MEKKPEKREEDRAPHTVRYQRRPYLGVEADASKVEYIYVLIHETPRPHHVKAGEALLDYEPGDS